MIISGVPERFGAVCDNFRGGGGATDGLERLHQSYMLYWLCGGNVVTLTECRRSEQGLFGHYRNVVSGGSRFETPLPDLVSDARKLFAFRGEADHNRVISQSEAQSHQ